MSPVVTHSAWLAHRSIVRTLRQPAAVLPSLLFPLVLLGLLTAGLGAAADTPGFPTSSYLPFALAGAIIQAAMVGGIAAGTHLAFDTETGFLDRLALTPAGRTALLLGPLAAAVTLALLEAVAFIAIGLAFGVSIITGPAGVLGIVVLAAVAAVAFAAVGELMALRVGSADGVQERPLTFVLLTFSSFFLPRALIEADWLRTLATVNPTSYLMEGIRSLLYEGWSPAKLALAVGPAAALFLFATVRATAALNRRLEIR